MNLGTDTSDGAYRDTDYDGETQRFTTYWSSTEEIDVDARNRTHAGLIAHAAAERDYQQGEDGIGRLVKIVFRPAGFMYF